MRTLRALALFAPLAAWANPGHGVELAHLHGGEFALLALAVGALVAWWRS